jgi:hypothetical protein
VHIIDTVMLFTKLGLVVHPEKSNFLPSQVIVILGFIPNSLTMTVTRRGKGNQFAKDC